MSLRPLLAAALLAPVLARAQVADPNAESGPLFALRAGVGVPAGDVSSGGPQVSDFVEGAVPVGFELGYRLSRRFWVELGFELAPAKPASPLCAAGTACSASDVRIVVQLVLRLLPGSRVDPWLGVGAGAEALNAEGLDAGTGARAEWTWMGFVLPALEAGADVALSDRIALGPWASLSFAQFTTDSVKPSGGGTVSGPVHGRVTHRWLSAGLQATLRL